MQNGKVTIGLIQMGVEKDREAMLVKALEKVKEAARAGAQVICLPELYRTPYFPRHPGADTSSLTETIPGESTGFFSMAAREHRVVIIVPLYERAPDGNYYNSAAVLGPDGMIGSPYHKIHIPQDPGFFEKGYFYPGNFYPVYQTPFGRIAVLICYDQWFPEAARCAALDGAELIIYPTAIGHPTADVPPEGGWQEAWELIQRSHAIANSVHIAAVNRVGKEGDCSFFGGSFVCDAFGKVLARASG
ncbi:nitrilase-related carbon-nitrogen hydrolase, partial [Methanoregula sp. PtaB.Bin085]|uniref:nitrilase-related carbon-nitrogen hydrolase n=1 Tax=Methanoregula sp. PtaB.Bin085 TaxID=1811680 RepID=UPI0025CDB983